MYEDTVCRKHYICRHPRCSPYEEQQKRGTVPAFSYNLLRPSITTCGEAGQDTQRLTGALTKANLGGCGYTEDDEVRKVAVGREMVTIRRFTSCCLNLALPFPTRPQLCRRWVPTITKTEETTIWSPGGGHGNEAENFRGWSSHKEKGGAGIRAPTE